MTAGPPTDRTKGGPLVMLALLIVSWGAVRAMWWENPFVAAARAAQGRAAMTPVPIAAAPAPLLNNGNAAPALPIIAAQPVALIAPRQRGAMALLQLAAPDRGTGYNLAGLPGVRPASAAAGHHSPARPFAAPIVAPFLPALPTGSAAVPPGRWSLDAWAFWRQGSNAAPVSQGRVPIYGASQTGAVLQYRLAPARPLDPRLYARAYRALVQGGESELALGTSLRPVPILPLRMAGEVRYTATPFRDVFRPAAYIVTEIAPVPLAYGARLEAYGQAGWVGGLASTGFADGQASITAAVPPIARRTDDLLHLSLGAGAWGGAQRGAHRLDIGPTLRLDMTIGAVPARLSVDWRERVAGTAAPDSGLTATLSTSF